ncbi:MAG: hypothetical protein FJ217_17185, partial [Ignavibacteria bacterium]|nr:hypothetical protein [Ignavibacteria bacterium]
VLFLFLASIAAAQPVRVEIDAGRVTQTISPWLYGINTARWDESLFPGPADEMLLTADRDAIAKVRASGLKLLKYPGGNDADAYIWNSPLNNATEMDTDEYIAFCRAVGAEPFITVNFNEPPALAAEWVRYCNIVRGYNVKLWEVGDEQWGTWAKGHAPPEAYAKKYISFVKAMRAVDPTIKVATNVPLGPHPENWTERVFRAAGDYIDMLTYTFFPQQWGKENDDTLFASVPRFKELVHQLRRDVERVVGREKADSILYVNVGYNSVNHSPGPQTLRVVNALWVADMLGTMAELGTDIACLWALHNFYPPRGGDYGYISSDASNTPRYTYYVFPMFVNHFGNQLLSASFTDPLLSVYASRAGKSLSVIVINKNREKTKSLEISLKDFTPQRTGKAWILDEKRKYEALPDLPNVAPIFPLKVPPYSMLLVQLLERDSVLPAQNIARLATPSASSFSTTGPHFTPSSAIDGLMYTRWNSAAWTKSNGHEVQWFQLAWKQPQTITRVAIHWGETHAVEYLLTYSVDGKEWRRLREVNDGNGGLDNY